MSTEHLRQIEFFILNATEIMRTVKISFRDPFSSEMSGLSVDKNNNNDDDDDVDKMKSLYRETMVKNCVIYASEMFECNCHPIRDKE